MDMVTEWLTDQGQVSNRPQMLTKPLLIGVNSKYVDSDQILYNFTNFRNSHNIP